MSSDEHLVTVGRPAPGVYRIAIIGTLDSQVAGPLDEAVEAAILDDATRIEIDLSMARVAVPEDLVCLVDVHRRTSRARVGLELVEVPDSVAEQMARTLLPALLPICGADRPAARVAGPLRCEQI